MYTRVYRKIPAHCGNIYLRMDNDNDKRFDVTRIHIFKETAIADNVFEVAIYEDEKIDMSYWEKYKDAGEEITEELFDEITDIALKINDLTDNG